KARPRSALTPPIANRGRPLNFPKTRSFREVFMKTAFVVTALGGLLLSGAVQAAELKVLASGAVKEAYTEMFPQFEKASGHTIAITWAGTVDIKKKIGAGEVYDFVVIASPDMDAFIKEGKIVAGSKADLVKSGVGVAVKAGATKPDFSSADAL